MEEVDGSEERPVGRDVAQDRAGRTEAQGRPRSRSHAADDLNDERGACRRKKATASAPRAPARAQAAGSCVPQPHAATRTRARRHDARRRTNTRSRAQPARGRSEHKHAAPLPHFTERLERARGYRAHVRHTAAALAARPASTQVVQRM